VLKMPEDEKPMLQGAGFRVVFIVAVLGLAAILFFMYFMRPLPRFDNVSGLSVGLGDSYRTLVEIKGEPHVIESVLRDSGSDLHAFHYEGVIFFFESFSHGEYHLYNSGIIKIEITSEQFRLGGRGWNRIGVGSTRSAVENDFKRRVSNSRWSNFGIDVVYREQSVLHNWPKAGFGYINTVHWVTVEFEFDHDDVVVRMIMGSGY